MKLRITIDIVGKYEVCKSLFFQELLIILLIVFSKKELLLLQ